MQDQGAGRQGGSPLPSLQMAIFLLFPHMTKREILCIMFFLIRVLIPLLRAPPSGLHYLPKFLTQVLSHWRSGYQHVGFVGTLTLSI